MLDKINERLSKIEYDIKDIKGNVAKLEEALNSVNSNVAEIKQRLEELAWKTKWRNYATDQGEKNLVFYNLPKKAEGQVCAEFIQDFIATHMGLETLCGHVEIERAHRTPTRREKNSDKKKPRPIHVAFLRYTDKAKIQGNLRADVSKYRPEVYKSEKSKILKKIHRVALGKLLT